MTTAAKKENVKSEYKVKNSAKRIKAIKALIRERDGNAVTMRSNINAIGQELSQIRIVFGKDNNAYGAWCDDHISFITKDYRAAYYYCYDNSSAITDWMKGNPAKFELTSPRSIQRQHKAFEKDSVEAKAKGQTVEEYRAEQKIEKKAAKDAAKTASATIDELINLIDSAVTQLEIEKMGNASLMADHSTWLETMTKRMSSLK